MSQIGSSAEVHPKNQAVDAATTLQDRDSSLAGLFHIGGQRIAVLDDVVGNLVCHAF